MLNLLEYLEDSASRTPDKPAFCGEDRRFSFGELLDFAYRCGTAIAHRVDAINRPVAVLTSRTAGPVAAFQAVLASGGYYVPIDAAMPAARMKAIFAQLRPSLLLYAAGQEQIAEQMSCFCPLLRMDEGAAEEADGPLLEDRRARVLDVDPAYAIFTSGSTGTPKGIVVSHRSVIDFVEWMADACRFSEQDVLANQAPFYFDLSVKDLYLTLKCGATCHILPKKLFLFPLLLLREIERLEATALVWATSAFHLTANSGALERCRPQTLNKVILGGEALGAKALNLWRAALPDVQYINLYGPTEVTVDCAWYPIPKERVFADGDAIPIGTACRNMEILLLDETLHPVETGQVGEICVRGIGLACGYYGDWDKTNAAFIQNPLNPWYPDRLYRTGDLGYWGADSLLYFAARKDHQIKHMGYRIELGEVETALNGVDGMAAAVCLFDPERDKIVCVCQTSLTDKEIVEAIRQTLPRYMQPNLYRRVDAMPYNANGKIDRVRLKQEYLG